MHLVEERARGLLADFDPYGTSAPRELRWKLGADAEDVLQQTTHQFRLTYRAPASIPTTQNLWVAAHMAPSDTTPLASAAFAGVPVMPGLPPFSLAVVGADIAAGATTDVAIQFISILDADALRLVAESDGFDFSAASALEFESSVTALSVHVRGFAIDPGAAGEVLLTGVRLGAAGPALFTLSLFYDERKVGELQSHVAAQIVGLADVLDAAVRPAFSLDPETFPVRDTFPPQLDAACVATLRVRLDLPVSAGDELRVDAPGFTFSSAYVDGDEIAATASGWAFTDDISAGAQVRLQLARHVS